MPRLAVSAQVYVRVIDNDEPSVMVTEAALSVTEGGASAMYIVKLLAAPTKDVFFDLIFDSAAISVTRQYTNSTTLVFEADGWTQTTQQVVAVAAVDDARDEDIEMSTQISYVIRSEDEFYGLANASYITPPPIVVTVTDNDLSAVLIDLATTKIVVRENGMVDHYLVRLATKPYAPVRVRIWPGDLAAAVAAEHEIYVQNGSSLFFNETNWNVHQTVTVAAVDDTDVEHACSAPMASSTPKPGQILRHQVVTTDAKYLKGCGPTRSCEEPHVYGMLSQCLAACTGTLKNWCGGCLIKPYIAANCSLTSNVTMLPNGTGCTMYEARQGVYHENVNFPNQATDADAYNSIQNRVDNFAQVTCFAATVLSTLQESPVEQR